MLIIYDPARGYIAVPDKPSETHSGQASDIAAYYPAGYQNVVETPTGLMPSGQPAETAVVGASGESPVASIASPKLAQTSDGDMAARETQSVAMSMVDPSKVSEYYTSQPERFWNRPIEGGSESMLYTGPIWEYGGQHFFTEASAQEYAKAHPQETYLSQFNREFESQALFPNAGTLIGPEAIKPLTGADVAMMRMDVAKSEAQASPLNFMRGVEPRPIPMDVGGQIGAGLAAGAVSPITAALSLPAAAIEFGTAWGMGVNPGFMAMEKAGKAAEFAAAYPYYTAASVASGIVSWGIVGKGASEIYQTMKPQPQIMFKTSALSEARMGQSNEAGWSAGEGKGNYITEMKNGQVTSGVAKYDVLVKQFDNPLVTDKGTWGQFVFEKGTVTLKIPHTHMFGLVKHTSTVTKEFGEIQGIGLPYGNMEWPSYNAYPMGGSGPKDISFSLIRSTKEAELGGVSVYRQIGLTSTERGMGAFSGIARVSPLEGMAIAGPAGTAGAVAGHAILPQVLGGSATEAYIAGLRSMPTSWGVSTLGSMSDVLSKEWQIVGSGSLSGMTFRKDNAMLSIGDWAKVKPNKPKQSLWTGSLLDTSTAQDQIQIQAFAFGTPTPNETRTLPGPAFGPPPSLPGWFNEPPPDFGGGGMLGGGGNRRYKRKYGYMPSMTALWFNIRGKKPRQKLFTGIEIRPLL